MLKPGQCVCECVDESRVFYSYYIPVRYLMVTIVLLSSQEVSHAVMHFS